MQCLLRLKTILQYKGIYLCLLIICLIYALIVTNIYIPHGVINSFEGIVTDKKIDGNKITLTLKGDEKIIATYYVDTKEELSLFEDMDLGITIRIEGEEQEINNNTIPNTFNYKEYLKRHNYQALVSISSYEIKYNTSNLFYSLKNALRDYIKTFKSKDYLETFIIGKKEYLDDEIYERYRDLGVSHIFAISGMHISLLIGILLKIMKRRKENTKYRIIIVFLIFYMFLTNYTASVMRSCFLFIILYLNKRWDFHLSDLNCYYICISLLLIFNPYYIYDIGFLYSSIITYALLRYQNILKGNYLISLIKISILALAFSLPITIMNNYEINVLSFINNIFFVPLVSVVIYPLSLITLFIRPLDNLLYIITHLLEVASSYMLVWNIFIPKLSIMIIIIYYVLLFLFMKSHKKGLIMAMITLILIPKLYPYLDDKLYIYYLDVRQGDSCLIKYRDEAILIDTGGIVSFNKEKWKEREKSYLTDNTMLFMKSIGIDNIDYLILSHGDYDHLGESKHLIENFPVHNVIFNRGEYNNLEKDIISLLTSKDIPYYQNIKELKIADTSLINLDTKTYSDENNNSLVFYMEYNDYRFLFMGDAGKEKEEDILSNYNLNNITSLKVGHHGSKTSSSEVFIDTIKPIYSIISVGKNNLYHHPSQETLDNLTNTNILRTDVDGTILLTIENDDLYLKTYEP